VSWTRRRRSPTKSDAFEATMLLSDMCQTRRWQHACNRASTTLT
jgi:hypothetical protein